MRADVIFVIEAIFQKILWLFELDIEETRIPEDKANFLTVRFIAVGVLTEGADGDVMEPILPGTLAFYIFFVFYC